MGQFNDISTIWSRPRLQFFFNAILILPASQVERLILSCICQVLSPSVEKYEKTGNLICDVPLFATLKGDGRSSSGRTRGKQGKFPLMGRKTRLRLFTIDSM